MCTACDDNLARQGRIDRLAHNAFDRGDMRTLQLLRGECIERFLDGSRVSGFIQELYARGVPVPR